MRRARRRRTRSAPSPPRRNSAARRHGHADRAGVSRLRPAADMSGKIPLNIRHIPDSPGDRFAVTCSWLPSITGTHLTDDTSGPAGMGPFTTPIQRLVLTVTARDHSRAKSDLKVEPGLTRSRGGQEVDISCSPRFFPATCGSFPGDANAEAPGIGCVPFTGGGALLRRPFCCRLRRLRRNSRAVAHKPIPTFSDSHEPPRPPFGWTNEPQLIALQQAG